MGSLADAVKVRQRRLGGLHAAARALRIVDRLKDVIKTGGEWVSAAELEALTLEHPAVAEAAYLGIADERWGGSVRLQTMLPRLTSRRSR